MKIMERKVIGMFPSPVFDFELFFSSGRIVAILPNYEIDVVCAVLKEVARLVLDLCCFKIRKTYDRGDSVPILGMLFAIQ